MNFRVCVGLHRRSVGSLAIQIIDGAKTMRKLLLASAILTIGVAGASAADLGPRSYTKAPALAPAYDWSGFYIGGQAGAASLSPSFKDDDHFFDSQSFNPDRKYSFTGGVYGGYNWQLNSLVVGVDAQCRGMATTPSRFSLLVPGLQQIPAFSSAPRCSTRAA